jgi:hypothetical protein
VEAPMPGGLIEPLPRNLTDTTRVLVRLPGAKCVANHPQTGELAGLSVEAALPIRRFYSWKGKRNYEGRWWCSTSGGHVEFESLLERDALTRGACGAVRPSPDAPWPTWCEATAS